MQPDPRVLTQRARDLRKHMTEAETVLWVGLRRHRIECHFRRQVVIGRFIVDFACLTHRTIVECDGEQHDESQYDIFRDRWLEAQGWTVLRFWNSEILGNLSMVLNTVSGYCQASTSVPG
jgi:very-short-patch-repair endonuclease